VLTRVPLIVRRPGEQTGRVTDLVELLDIAPTLAQEAGASLPASFSGSQLPEINGDTLEDTERTAISEADLVPAYHGSARTPEWRYVRDDVSGTELLFNLDDPPGDRMDVAAENEDAVERLRKLLDDRVTTPERETGDDMQQRGEDIDDSDVEERLKTLGYLE
jgi:Arylsulfatase A and related enzymes